LIPVHRHRIELEPIDSDVGGHPFLLLGDAHNKIDTGELMSENSKLSGESMVSNGTSRMWRWQAALFRFLSRNALDVAAFYDIPIEQVIEAGVRLRL